MIYQGFFDEGSRARCFEHPNYHPVDLPSVAETLGEGWDEPTIDSLSEWPMLLWAHRQAVREHEWVGFTSYRQDDKVPDGLRLDRERIEALLEEYDIVTWRWAVCTQQITHPVTGEVLRTMNCPLYFQCEMTRPGINAAMAEALARTGNVVPKGWYTNCGGIFCNYWAMKNATFDAYMKWVYPVMFWIVDNWNVHPLLGRVVGSHTAGSANPGRVRYGSDIMERLVNVWQMATGASVYDALNSTPIARTLGEERLRRLHEKDNTAAAQAEE